VPCCSAFGVHRLLRGHRHPRFGGMRVGPRDLDDLVVPHGDGARRGTDGAAVRRNPVRRLYDWMLSWADHKAGPRAVRHLLRRVVVLPDPAGPAAAGARARPAEEGAVFGAICTLGSILGGMLGYAIGWFVWDVVGDFFFLHVPGRDAGVVRRRAGLVHRWGFWAVFLAGLHAAAVQGVHAGVRRVPDLVPHLRRGQRDLARRALLHRRGLVYFYGPPIQRFIDRHFNRLAWAFGILLVAGFVALRFLR
jgi:membrane protein YqaA with SNARE-associated domain